MKNYSTALTNLSDPGAVSDLYIEIP
ncbi:DUF3219 family protein [Bacillus subtilis]|nr:DUF3219 family protein [Bacillus subtilis]MDD9763760.1 DUF3219 family protein [Bacillus subtilis]